MNRPRSKLLKRIAVSVGVFLGAALMWFLFRTERLESPPPRGLLEGSYRWGRLHTIRVDGDLDGVFELRAIVAPGASLRDEHTWEVTQSESDFDGNGRVDAIHRVVQVGQLAASVYWIDVDGDGILETVSLDQDGAKLLVEVRRTRGRAE